MRATIRCTCICSCTELKSYPLVRSIRIPALTCVNARTTPSEPQRHHVGLGIFPPMRLPAGGRVMLVVQPSGGSASQPILGLGRVTCGWPAGGGTRTGPSRENGGNSRHLPWLNFLRCARCGASAKGLHYRARTAYPQVFQHQLDNQKKAGGPPGVSWLTGGTERHGTTDGPPFSTSREGGAACTTLLSRARSA